MDMNKRLIYVIDDEPLFARLLQVNLQRVGYEVMIELDGVQAMSSLLDGNVSPDLVLLDLSLPHLDGIELLRGIRQNETLSQLPVIILTAISHDADIRAAHSLGIFTYIVKPIDPKSLVKTISDALDSDE